VESVFSDDGITEADLRAGRYDFAEVRMFLVNYQDLGQGVLKLRRGWLGEVLIRDCMYVAELRGMAQKLQMKVGQVYTPDGAADLGDTRCGIEPSPRSRRRMIRCRHQLSSTSQHGGSSQKSAAAPRKSPLSPVIGIAVTLILRTAPSSPLMVKCLCAG
jgi:uncharacterized phage protein (TIGR02218 family)